MILVQTVVFCGKNCVTLLDTVIWSIASTVTPTDRVLLSNLTLTNFQHTSGTGHRRVMQQKETINDINAAIFDSCDAAM